MGYLCKTVLEINSEDESDAQKISDIIKELEELQEEGFTHISLTMGADWEGEYMALSAEVQAEKQASKHEIEAYFESE